MNKNDKMNINLFSKILTNEKLIISFVSKYSIRPLLFIYCTKNNCPIIFVQFKKSKDNSCFCVYFIFANKYHYLSFN